MSGGEGGVVVADSARVIKRYANRKLYDTGARRFTSLTAIRRMVEDGVEVVVLDHDTGADRTEEVLTQVLRRRDPSDDGVGIPVISELIRAPGRLVRVVLGDEKGDLDELERLRGEVDELSRKLDKLVVEAQRNARRDEPADTDDGTEP